MKISASAACDKSQDIISKILLLAALCCLGYFAYDYAFRIMRGLLIDDAYIGLRHAENFANGYGLNFNTTERVEGYTSFSYVVLQSIPYFLKLDPLMFAKGLGIAGGLFFIAATYFLGRHYLSPLTAGLMTLTLSLCGNVQLMSVWGLETILYAAMVAVALLAAVKQRPVLAGVLAALAAMTRMEASLVTFSIGLYYLLQFYLAPAHIGLGFASRLSKFCGTFPATFFKLPVVRFSLAFLAMFMPYFIARAIYYDALMPNTFTSKVGTAMQMSPRGARFMIEIYKNGWLWLPVLLVAFPFLLTIRGSWVKYTDLQTAKAAPRWLDIGLIVFLIALYHVYIVRVGGDHFATFRDRFLVHSYAPYFVLFFYMMERAAMILSGEGTKWLRGCIFHLGMPLLLAATFAYVHYLNFRGGYTGIPYSWKAVGLWMHDHVKPTDILATDAAGAIPYYSKLRTIDMLGKANRHIGEKLVPTMGQGPAAHEKDDPFYVMNQKPDWLTTWMGRNGDVGRGMWNYFNWRQNYDLYATVDGRWGDFGGENPGPFGSNRIQFVQSDQLNESGLLRMSAKEKGGWGIWRRRTVPREKVVLSARDFKTNIGTVNVDAAATDRLVLASAGTSGTAFYGPYLKFRSGHYFTTLTVAFEAASKPAERRVLYVGNEVACTFETVRDMQVLGPRLSILTKDLQKPKVLHLISDFSVDADGEDKPYAFRMSCFGQVGVTLVHAEISEMPGAGPVAPRLSAE